MRICDDLRQAVLQAAIQGKLTTQLPEDGNASDLLKQTIVEKERLIKEKKIKKEKLLPEISPDEIPFDIPENWKWVRLQYICKSITAGGDKPKDFSKEKTEKYSIPVIANGETNKGVMGFTAMPSIIEKAITVSGRGTIGYSVVRTEPFFPIVRLLVLTFIDETTLLEYLQIVLTALMENGIGSAVHQLTVPMISPKAIPLPPLAEQHRIVARVEELMAQIDDLEKTETELEKLKAAFPGDMKAALLQAAMQGKLTEQLPEDGDAADLINQIAKEKSELIKEGKIKKEKPLPDITPDEMPFDIPENWQWVRHNAIFDVVGGSQPAKSFFRSEPEKGYVRLYQIRDYGETPVPVYVPNDMVSKFTEEDDILLARYGGSLGKVFKAHKGAYNVALARVCFLFLSSLISKDFLYYYYLSPLYQNFVRGQSNGRSAQGGFNKTDLISLLFPLPPLAEQKRIVEKLDKLLPLCDGLVEE